MSDKDKEKARTCKKCHEDYMATAEEIQEHERECEGKDVVDD